MNAIAHRKTVRKPGLILLVSIIAVLAFADGAGAMQEYKDLKVLVEQIEADLNSIMQDSYPEGLGVKQFTFDAEQIPQILALIDELERKMVEMNRPTDAVKKKASRMGLRKTKKYMKSLGRA
jgi:hypothetical protein